MSPSQKSCVTFSVRCIIVSAQRLSVLPRCHPLSSSFCPTDLLLSESATAAARAPVFGRKSWVLKLKPSRSEHPIQKPIQHWYNGVEGSSTFTGLITHLAGPCTRLNSCIMSAVWPIDLPVHCQHVWVLPHSVVCIAHCVEFWFLQSFLKAHTVRTNRTYHTVQKTDQKLLLIF